MTTSKEFADAQRAADKAHHQQRVKWLESSNPKYSDGPVLESDRRVLLEQSRSYLSNPAAGGMNHCHCDPPCGA